METGMSRAHPDPTAFITTCALITTCVLGETEPGMVPGGAHFPVSTRAALAELTGESPVTAAAGVKGAQVSF